MSKKEKDNIVLKILVERYIKAKQRYYDATPGLRTSQAYEYEYERGQLAGACLALDLDLEETDEKIIFKRLISKKIVLEVLV